MKRFAVYSGCALLLIAAVAEAATIVIANGAPRLILRVGSGGATINLVTISVPGLNVGNSVAVNGTVAPAGGGGCPADTVLVDAQARATPANIRTATLTADSAVPLTAGTFTVPLTQIAWTSTNPGGGGCLNAPVTIPSGTYAGAAGQALISFLNSRRACTCKQFRYLNQNIVSAGTYTGRVTYTLSMP